MPTVRALIFDLDGVLVDAEPIHMQAWQEILARRNIRFSARDYEERFLGLDDRGFVPKIFAEHRQTLTAQLTTELIAAKLKRVNELLTNGIPVVPGAAEFLKKVSKKFPMALVTNSLRAEVERILAQVDFRKYFSLVVTAEDVRRGKPDPEGYQKAFHFLEQFKSWTPALQKKECLVFEDSETGMTAARAAGLPVRQIHKKIPGDILGP